jgi:hypothetical protein
VIQVLRYLAGGIAAAAVILFIVYGGAALDNVNPDLDDGSRFVATYLPFASKSSDYVGQGWQYRIRQGLCLLTFVVAMFIWGLAGA